jgi:hypothetical protein
LNPVKKIFLLVFSVSLIYAVLRYHIFGGVDLRHFPLYVFNKVVALSGFLLLISSSLLSLVNSRIKEERDMIGFGSLILIIIHVFISLAILGPEYFQKFYSPDGRMNLTGELSMFFGVLGLASMWMVNRYFSLSGMLNRGSGAKKEFKKLINLAIIAGFFHTLIMGLKGWLIPAEWHGYLPPITLLSALGVLVWIYFLLGKKRIT